MSSTELPRELVWASDGHLDEVALTALADGQILIVPADARTHSETCEACAGRLGLLALASLEAGEALALLPERTGELAVQAVPTAAAARSGRRPTARSSVRSWSPVWPIAAAIAVGFFGAIPTLLALPAHLADHVSLAMHVLPALFRSGVLVANGALDATPAAIALRCLSAAVLIGAGFFVVRVLPQPQSGSKSVHELGSKEEVDLPWVR
jgi:hypothetical protein